MTMILLIIIMLNDHDMTMMMKGNGTGNDVGDRCDVGKVGKSDGDHCNDNDI